MAQPISNGLLTAVVSGSQQGGDSSKLKIISVLFQSLTTTVQSASSFLQYMGGTAVIFQSMTGVCGALVAFKDILPRAGQSLLAFGYMIGYFCNWTEAMNYVNADNCPSDINPIAYTAAKKVRERLKDEGLDCPEEIVVKISNATADEVTKEIGNIEKPSDLDTALRDIFEQNIKSQAFDIEIEVKKDNKTYKYSYHRKPGLLLTYLFTKSCNATVSGTN